MSRSRFKKGCLFGGGTGKLGAGSTRKQRIAESKADQSRSRNIHAEGPGRERFFENAPGSSGSLSRLKICLFRQWRQRALGRRTRAWRELRGADGRHCVCVVEG